MPGPIKPTEVQKRKSSELPEEVFTVFNDLIVKHWTGSQARIYQNEVVGALMEAMSILRSEVFSRDLLNVEDAYAEAGWEVEYDKPGYNETYEAFFIFRK